MITANTKVTALDILNELGIENAEAKFGAVRVRIGGVPGINTPDRLITIQPDVKKLDVVVGNEWYELELHAGTPENNKTIFTITESAKAAIKTRGEKANEKAEKIQAVKQLVNKIKKASDKGIEYTPTKAEEKFLDKANEKIELDEIAQAAANDATRVARKPTKVQSK